MLKTRAARAAQLFVLFKPMTLGPLIREKRSRGLHTTRTPRYRSSWLTSSASSSRHGLSWPMSLGLCLSWPRLTLDVKVFSYKCTQALSAAQARERLCICTCFVIITQTSFLLPSIRLRKMASVSSESRITKEKIQRKSEPLECPGRETTSRYL